jgi:hypothetical protein
MTVSEDHAERAYGLDGGHDLSRTDGLQTPMLDNTKLVDDTQNAQNQSKNDGRAEKKRKSEDEGKQPVRGLKRKGSMAGGYDMDNATAYISPPKKRHRMLKPKLPVNGDGENGNRDTRFVDEMLGKTMGDSMTPLPVSFHPEATVDAALPRGLSKGISSTGSFNSATQDASPSDSTMVPTHGPPAKKAYTKKGRKVEKVKAIEWPSGPGVILVYTEEVKRNGWACFEAVKK